MLRLLAAVLLLLGSLLGGCATSQPVQKPVALHAVPLEDGSGITTRNDDSPAGMIPASGDLALPPPWYWYERQSQQLERQLQQQRHEYYLNRRPAPQFQRPLNCQSYAVGGQVHIYCQ